MSANFLTDTSESKFAAALNSSVLRTLQTPHSAIFVISFSKLSLEKFASIRPSSCRDDDMLPMTYVSISIAPSLSVLPLLNHEEFPLSLRFSMVEIDEFKRASIMIVPALSLPSLSCLDPSRLRWVKGGLFLMIS